MDNDNVFVHFDFFLFSDAPLFMSLSNTIWSYGMLFYYSLTLVSLCPIPIIPPPGLDGSATGIGDMVRLGLGLDVFNYQSKDKYYIILSN